MPQVVICSGCGKNLNVNDSHLGKRLKCPQCGETFVATASEEQENGGVQKMVDRLSSLWPIISGLALIGLGLLVVIKTAYLPGGRMISRVGLGMIGLGIATIGYWALSSENKDYNF